jgi:20S proteasome subunit beta 4
MRGATILKASDDKTRKLNKQVLMAFVGEAGDTSMGLVSCLYVCPHVLTFDSVQFAEYIQANIQLYSMRNSIDLTPSETASFVRSELAKSLRSRSPYNVNLLLGGFDTITNKPTLHWIDYLASCASLPYAAHGYAQYYCLSTLDKHHHPDIDFDQGMKILRMCTDELKRRLPIDFKGVFVKVITKDGIRDEPYEDGAPVYAP